MTASLISIPIRLGRGMNDRGHWAAKARRVTKEERDVFYCLRNHQRWHGKPAVPCSVLLTRIAPGNGLDDDNLVSALKNVRDGVAMWLGVNDKDRMTVRYRYGQRRGDWGVEIEFGPPVSGAQLTLEGLL